jgi:hypothetical protein
MNHLRLCLICCCIQLQAAAQFTFNILEFGDPLSVNRGGVSIIDNNNNIYFAGTVSNGTAGSDDIAITKILPNGTIAEVWNIGYEENEFVNNMVYDNHKFLYVCGNKTDSITGLTRGFLMKVDTTGTVYWTETSTFSDVNADFIALHLLATGEIAVTGFVSDLTGEGNNVLIFTYGEDGNIMQDFTFGGISNEVGLSILDLPGGDYIVAGDIEITPTLYNPFYARINRQQEIIFFTTFDIAQNSGCKSMILNAEGNLAFCGEIAGVLDPQFDLLVATADTSGNILSITATPGIGIEAGYDIAAATDSTYMITGFGFNTATDEHDIVVIETDDDGNVIHRKFFGNTGPDLTYDIKVIDGYHFLVSGFTTIDGTKYFTVIYDAFVPLSAAWEQLNTENIIITPQPAINYMHIKTGFPINKIELLSLNGQLLNTYCGNQSSEIKLEIDVELNIYMLKIISANRICYKKIIAGQ